MIKISNVQIKHGGILANGSAKLTLYLPECTAEQHAEVVKLAMDKIIGIVLVEPENLELISTALEQLADLSTVDTEQPAIDDTIEKDNGEDLTSQEQIPELPGEGAGTEGWEDEEDF